MKGLAILLTLAVITGGALFALLRDSDQDLVRVEDEISEALDQAADRLASATRTIDPLRTINPTAFPLDKDLGDYRENLASQRAALDQLRATRPESESQRGAFLKQRRDARDSAHALVQQTQSLVERGALLEEILRDLQPRVQTMQSLMGMVHEARRAVAATDDLSPELATRLDQLQVLVGNTRVLAAETRKVAMVDAKQARDMHRTLQAEVSTIIKDLEAAMDRLRTTDTGGG